MELKAGEKIGPIIAITCLNASIDHSKFRERKEPCIVDRFVLLTGTACALDSCLIPLLKNNSNCAELWVWWKEEEESDSSP